MKKLRLLITEACDRDCPMCCNKQHNLAKLHVEANLSRYSEIILTGGEPMIDVNYLIEVIEYIKDHISTDTKIWLYTAKVDRLYGTLDVLDLIDGITITIHNETDIPAFMALDDQLHAGWPRCKRKSLRVYIFDGVDMSNYRLPKCNWNVKRIQWLTDCPLPEGEVFKRFAFID